MKLLFLGTGAADWNIAARTDRDDAEFRRFSSALLDRTLLLDPGPHIFDFAERNGTLDIFDGVTDILVTHSHMDHFCSDTVRKLCARSHINIYGDSGVYRKLLREYLPPEEGNYSFFNASHGKKLDICNYSVLPTMSNHATGDPDEQTLNYTIESKIDGKKLFYGLDGAWFIYKSWLLMRTESYDAMILEATVGDIHGDDRVFSHNSLPMLEIMLETIRAQGCIKPDGKIYISHMARTLHERQKLLEARVAPLDITVLYDGAEINI